MNFFEKQKSTAKINYSYFFVKLIFSIFKIVFNLSIVLLIGSIFNYIFTYIISLIYTIYSLYNIGKIWNYYFDIIDDIKDTLGYDNLSFEVDSSLIQGVVKYGR